MKSMLYVGAALMLGASIYGFADFKKTSHKKEFSTMYTEKKDPVPVVAEKTTAPVTEKKATESKTTGRSVERKLSKKAQDPGIKPIPQDEKMVAAKTDLDNQAKVTVTPKSENFIMKTVKKKRKLSSKLFSRAPLRDEEEELPVPVKEVKKTESKENHTENKEQ